MTFFLSYRIGIKSATAFLKKEVCMNTAIAKRQNDLPSVTFGNVVDNIFQNSLRRFFDDNFWDVEGQLTTGSVPVNVREMDHQYEIDVIAPGCKKDDFHISINDNLLTISFNTNSENNRSQKAGWVRNEYVQRSFSRSFTLDDTVDVNKINATYTDGILRLTLAKNEKAKKISKQIEIQ
jgi:HSP20 family protein